MKTLSDNNMNKRKTTSIKISPEIWNKFKIYVIQKKIDMSKLLEKLIEKEVKKEK